MEKADCKATVFTTHDTPMNREIISRGHNLGIHPNFLPGSSQGNDIKNIVSECLKYAPDAWCMRTHSLFQSTPLLHEIFGNFPQLKLDVSILMHRSHFAHKTCWSLDGVSFDRLLYNWQDDGQFYSYSNLKKPELFFGDLTVFNFHPIHVFLNSTDGREYRQLKKELTGKPISSINIDTVNKYVNRGIGTQSYLEAVLNSNNVCLELGDI